MVATIALALSLGGCLSSPATAGLASSGCEYDGRTWSADDSFPATDGCNTCHCVDGAVNCTTLSCTCEYNGQTYSPGDEFEAIDECNSCTCEPDGSVACTGLGCDNCVVDGVFHDSGSIWSADDGCNSCTCEDGEVYCSQLDCGPPCEHGGQSYFAGEAFQQNGCELCTCQEDGEIACTDGCVEMCEHLGQLYEIGAAWRDQCTACTCLGQDQASCNQVPCPEECQADPSGLGPYDDCPEETTCVFEPCDTCGVPPMGYCLPEPAHDTCWHSQDCAGGQVCVNAEPSFGVAGQCLPAPLPGGCWSDVACPSVAICEGTWFCPPTALCDSEGEPGTCVPEPWQEPQVVLWLAEHTLTNGSPIAPLWFNFTAEPVYVGGCTTYVVEEQLGGEWVIAPEYGLNCGWLGYAQEIPPDGVLVPESYVLALPDELPHQLRLRGTYGLGCTTAKPLAPAHCASLHEVYHPFEGASLFP